MPKTRPLRIPFPVGGLNRKYAYSDQPPRTAMRCQNVRPTDVMEERERGGSRPGLGKAYGQHLGGAAITNVTKPATAIRITTASTPAVGDIVGIAGVVGATEANGVWKVSAISAGVYFELADSDISLTSYTSGGTWGMPVNLLNTVSVVPTDNRGLYSDQFEGGPTDGVKIGYPWQAAAWAADGSPTLISSNRPFAGMAYAPANDVTACVQNIVPMNIGSTYWIEMQPVAPYTTASGASAGYNGSYRLFAMLSSNGATGSSTTGLQITLTMTDAIGTFSGTVKIYDGTGGTTWNNTAARTVNFTTTASPTGDSRGGWFSARISGTSVKVYWLEHLVADVTLTGGEAAALTGRIVGFGIESTSSTYSQLAESFRAQWTATATTSSSATVVVAGAGGKTYYESPVGQLNTSTTTLTTAKDRALQSVEMFQDLYIADWSETLHSGTASTTSAAPTIITGSGTNWVDGINNVNDYAVEIITQATGEGITPGVYYMASIDSDTQITLTASTGCTTNGTFTYRILRCPKIYDPLTDTMTKYVATVGSTPIGCPLITRYRDRIVLAGDPPQLWYMSRAGDPLDFDFGASDLDATRAVAGSTSPAGTVGEPLTALIAYGDEYMIFGGKSSLWQLRGDPTLGGRIVNLSYKIGVISANSWTHGAGGEIYLLSNDGLYYIPPGSVAEPLPLSVGTLPDNFRGIDTNSIDVSLAYNVEERGIDIYLSKKDLGVATHWFFYLPTKSFWPMAFGAGGATDKGKFEPKTAFGRVARGGENNTVLIGCRDGYIRRSRDTIASDDGTAFDSFVYLGPIMLGANDTEEGILKTITGVLSAFQVSGGVTWTLYVADTPDELLSATAAGTGTWVQGLNNIVRPRRRGVYAAIKLSNASNSNWVFERVVAELLECGRVRSIS